MAASFERENMNSEQAPPTSPAMAGEVEYAAAQSAVLLCAVAALVRSHPAPEAFAAEFRRAWLDAGHPNTNELLVGAGVAATTFSQGLSVALEVLEEACAVPLNIRPPGVACLPNGGRAAG